MKKGILFLLLLLTCISAASVEDLFQKGNTFYQEGLFDSAATRYDEALTQEVNSVLLYNRGNCAYRLGQNGEAILCYERALLRDPKNPDITKSLAFLKTQIVDKEIVVEESFMGRAFTVLQNLIPMRGQLWILFILSLTFTFGLYLVLYKKGNRRIVYIYFSGIIFVLFLLVGASLLFKINRIESEEYAIILKERVTAMNEPVGKKSIFTAHEGTKVLLVKSSGEWSQIALANGTTGWVPGKSIGKIN